MIEFFCDIGSNFITKDGPSYDRALELIETAAEIGCTGVKFQYFKADKLWHPSMTKEIEAARARELKIEWIDGLSAVARYNGLLFGLSVFDKDDVLEVEPYVDYFKIASFEIGLFDLVEKCYLTGKRLMLSAGQSDKDEIFNICKNLPQEYDDGINGQIIDILHCVSKYPAQIQDCNLNIIKSNPWINGYSDHTTEPSVFFAAVALGAKVIEFHLDLNDSEGLETDHSWDYRGLGGTILFCEEIEQALGTDNWDEIIKLQDRKYKANPETGLRGKPKIICNLGEDMSQR